MLQNLSTTVVYSGPVALCNNFNREIYLMEKGSLHIHSENILPIIKKWLYTERDIFARELISNGSDAIQKLRFLQEKEEAPVDDQEMRIDVTIDREKGTLTFSDTGIGMTAEEVKKYIAQIAFSGAEEFVAKYQGTNEQDSLIGHFGLGFYSAYMVAKKVVIQTRSYQLNSEAVEWECDGSSDYQIGRGTRQARGTDVILYVDPDHAECLDALHMEKLLHHFCSFLPTPIYLNGKRINPEEPLWIKPSSECTEKEYQHFYHVLYPLAEEPLFWVHLNVDYPFRLKGVLYFPKWQRDVDLNRSHITLYCNRVFVSDDCKGLIPRYLTMLQGVIDSPDIPLNVSRSTLQMDKTVRQVANHIAKKVSDSLSTLYETDRERFLNCWQDISPIIKLAVLEDEKFYERAKEFLVWQKIGGGWTTAQEYLDLHGQKTQQKIFYSLDAKPASHLVSLYESKGLPILAASSPVDIYVIHFLEKKLSPAHFQRIDAQIEEALLDKTKEKTLLDAEGKTEGTKLAEFIAHTLGKKDLIVEAKSLSSSHLPGLVLIEEKERRMRDYLAKTAPQQPPLPVKMKFIVNTNSPFVHAVQKLHTKKPDLSKQLTEQMYELALLAQGEMASTEHLHRFIEANTQLLEKLTQELTQ